MSKKTLCFLLFGSIIVIFPFLFFEYSFGQGTSLPNVFIGNTEMIIVVQTFVENSEGQLVTYLASDKFTDLNFAALDILLDSEASETDPLITINGKKFQVIQRSLTIPYDRENVIASTIMAHSQNDELVQVARFAHDGYPIINGDQVKSVWTFIRPYE